MFLKCVGEVNCAVSEKSVFCRYLYMYVTKIQGSDHTQSAQSLVRVYSFLSLHKPADICMDEVNPSVFSIITPDVSKLLSRVKLHVKYILPFTGYCPLKTITSLKGYIRINTQHFRR